MMMFLSDLWKMESYPREFAKCRRCRKAKYCGKECQSTAWSEGHRFWCSAKDVEVDVNQVGTLHCTEWFHSRNGYSVLNDSGSRGPMNPWMWVYAVARPADEIIDLPPVEKSAVYWFLQHIRRYSALIPASYPAQYLANFRNKCCTISVTLPEQMPEAQSGTIWQQQHLFISGTISGARSGIINICHPAKYEYFPASRSERNRHQNRR